LAVNAGATALDALRAFRYGEFARPLLHPGAKGAATG
jgi:hypothetical protein